MTVQLWWVDLRDSSGEYGILRQTLSPGEIERADAFLVERARRHFVFGAGMTRVVLSGLLGATPEELCFEVTADGKPRLAGKHADSGIHYNLAHSGDLVVLAVCREAEVGVDVECMEDPERILEVADRVLSLEEKETFRTIPPSLRAEQLYRVWTRKEAVLKALGAGLRIPMESFSLPGLEAAGGFVKLPQCIGFVSASCPQGYAAAVAVNAASQVTR